VLFAQSTCRDFVDKPASWRSFLQGKGGIMRKQVSIQLTAIALVGVLFTGCENLPGNKPTQGAVIGGATGAAAGAVIGGEKNRAAGAVIGGVLGAAGGYVIGANSDKILGRDKDDADSVGRRAQTAPVSVDQARTARTADVNTDGYVTLDEVVAMKNAGLSDREMLNRLEATGQIFDLNAESQRYLRDQGVSEAVIQDMQNLNQARRQQLMQQLNQKQ
jgi:hypothetical protein